MNKFSDILGYEPIPVPMESMDNVQEKNSEDLRDRFEAWIKAPPFELDVEKWPYDETKHNWPGQYRDYTVQLAWEAWQEASK